jgi:hypothetical protein
MYYIFRGKWGKNTLAFEFHIREGIAGIRHTYFFGGEGGI